MVYGMYYVSEVSSIDPGFEIVVLGAFLIGFICAGTQLMKIALIKKVINN
jgi:hypothetical protein